jgi:hypothetical protein
LSLAVRALRTNAHEEDEVKNSRLLVATDSISHRIRPASATLQRGKAVSARIDCAGVRFSASEFVILGDEWLTICEEQLYFAFLGIPVGS